MRDEVHDFIAIGLGPFNLSLACLAEPLPGLRGLFLERNTEFNWHPGMLIDDATLQNHFLADLVSLADPTSRFSFLNHCKEEGRLYSYYFRENFYLMRAAYNHYCRWAAAQLTQVRFGHDVQAIVHDAGRNCYVVSGVQGEACAPFVLHCRRLVLGVGSKPALPACCENGAADGHRWLHTADYLERKAQLQQRRSITIVGSGQSAAEVYHDLLQEADAHDYSLTWLTRAPRFFQMETTKLTLEMFSPDYLDYFYGLDAAKREHIVRTQSCLYKGINASLLDRIYDLLDERRARGSLRTRLLTNCELQQCRYDAQADGYRLEFRQLDCEARYAHRTEGLVFATGYSENIPPFVDGIRHRLRWDEKGRYRLARNYAADFEGNQVFVQNAGQHTHGMTSPDLGMSCYRNTLILRELTGVEHYRVERRIAIQDFSVPVGADFVRLQEGVAAP